MNFDLSAALAAITPGRPLIVTDADGVVLRFTGGLERYLNELGLYLDLSTRRYSGAVKRQDDHTSLLDVEAQVLVEEFRADLDDLEAVDGACEALRSLKETANIVVLSNITERQAEARRRNFQALGIDLPLIANDSGQGYTGGKGAVVKALAARAGAKTFFIDDLPENLAEVGGAAPDVLLIHIAENPELREYLSSGVRAHCLAETWEDAAAFIREQLG